MVSIPHTLAELKKVNHTLPDANKLEIGDLFFFKSGTERTLGVVYKIESRIPRQQRFEGERYFYAYAYYQPFSDDIIYEEHVGFSEHEFYDEEFLLIEKHCLPSYENAIQAARIFLTTCEAVLPIAEQCGMLNP